MADVFISYHMKSAGEIVRQIAAALESVEITCWYAERDLPLGATWSTDIVEAIGVCKVLLLILDEKSNLSEHVQNELNLAFQRIARHQPVKIVTFKVDDCAVSKGVSYYISRFQTVNGNPPDKERIQELTEQLTVIIKGSPTWAMVGELKNKISELEYEQIQQAQTLQNRKQALERAQTKIRELQQEQAKQAQALQERKQTLELAQTQISELKQELAQQSTALAQAQESTQRINALERALKQAQAINRKKQKKSYSTLVLKMRNIFLWILGAFIFPFFVVVVYLVCNYLAYLVR